jgi:hypothetical protein
MLREGALFLTFRPMDTGTTYTRLPRVTVKEVAALVDTEYYKARVLAGAFGFSTTRMINRDYERGVIDRNKARLSPTPSGRFNLEIQGSEIKRIVREGRRAPRRGKKGGRK